MMRRAAVLFSALISILTPAAHAADSLLSPDRVWTGEGLAHANWSVLIVQDKIAAVGPTEKMNVPAGVERIRLPGATLIPGLMDLHSHVLLHPYNEASWDDQVLKESVEYRTLLAGRHAATTLQAGFTTLRDLGTEGALYADVAIKKAIGDGVIPRSAFIHRHPRDRRHRQLRPVADWIKVYADYRTGADDGAHATFAQAELWNGWSVWA
ncbi:MAG: amidohydrolase family protein [Pseudomonadota bacterium]